MALTQQTIQQVWQESQYVDPQNEAKGFRKDQCGAWIQRAQYGNRHSVYGWEIDHITPVSQGGSDQISNLRSLHWKNNAGRSDGRLVCVVTSDGTSNVASRAVLYR